MANYTLYYWPFLPGRGEYVRLMFEASGVEYDDIARRPEAEGGGVPAIQRMLTDDSTLPPLAVPVLAHAGQRYSQLANILSIFAPRLGMITPDPLGQDQARQLMLTICDVIGEAHDTHHPISTTLRYEDQQAAAVEAAGYFRAHRLPKYLGYFERILGTEEWFIGDAVSYLDLAVAHTLDGLAYAFPKAVAALRPSIPALLSLEARCWALPRLAAYRASSRRMAFNEDGIFRRYPALDG